MTDNEIIKALECCINEDNDLFNCGKQNCVFMECKMEKDRDCLYYMMKAVLDLINRLKAENENKNVEIDILIRKKETLRDEISELTAAVERLEEERDAMHRDVITAEEYAWNLNEKLKTAKSEAIKEFAERLKAISHPYGDTQMVFELQIDNLVKEMVGDE